MAALLRALRKAGAGEQAAALAERAAVGVSLDDPYSVAILLDGLREAGAREQAAALTARLPAAGLFALFLRQEGRADQFRFGREPDGTPAAPWDWDDLDLRPPFSDGGAGKAGAAPAGVSGRGPITGHAGASARRAAWPAGTPSRKTRPLDSPVTGA